jgi:tryptophan synthase beta chain
MKPKAILLPAGEMPRQWYNILADIKVNPPLGPDGKPISPDMLSPVFPMSLLNKPAGMRRAEKPIDYFVEIDRFGW